jgi:DNA-binding SARP family transcriptional activator
MAPILDVRLLGEFSLCYDGMSVAGVGSARLQSLLAYLLLHRDALQSRTHLALRFWPDSTEAQAHSNLRTLLYRLRGGLPDASLFLEAGAQTVHWRPDAPCILDVAEFEAGLTRAEGARMPSVAVLHGRVAGAG